MPTSEPSVAKERHRVSKQADRATVIVGNEHDIALLAVLMPTGLGTRDPSAVRTVPVSFRDSSEPDAGDAGSGVRRNEQIVVEADRNPYGSMINPGGSRQFDVGGDERLTSVIICTLPPEGDSQRSTGDISLRYWGSIEAQGGQAVAVLPAFFEGASRKTAVLDRQDAANMMYVAVALDGSYSEARLNLAAGPTAAPSAAEPKRKFRGYVRFIQALMRSTRTKESSHEDSKPPGSS